MECTSQFVLLKGYFLGLEIQLQDKANQTLDLPFIFWGFYLLKHKVKLSDHD